jgi:hypothetical protein
MPELRTIEGRERLRAPVAIVYDPDHRAKSAAQRRRRRGRSGPVPVEVRNGLPFKPYVYRGLGYDQYGDDDA